MGREQRAATGVRDHEITWRRACKIARQQQFHLEFQLLQRPQGALLLLPVFLGVCRLVSASATLSNSVNDHAHHTLVALETILDPKKA